MTDLENVIGTVHEATIGESAFEEFRASLRGSVIRVGDDAYEETRKVWNGMVDRRPLLIVRCAGPADVMAAVSFARAHSLLVSVRGGGHNVAGNAVCDGGMVIDLSAMRSVRVDPLRKVVRVEGGAMLGDVDHETQAFGLAVPMGVMSRTGVAGLALHGGMGLLTRKYGLTLDNLVGADVVTADGRLLNVDEHNHSDLFWALRGGGGNFGVVTSFEFQAYPVGPEVWLAMVLYPVHQAQKVLSFFRDFMAQAPDEIMSIAIFWNAPMEEPVPEEHHGAPVIVLLACHCGPFEEGERAVQPFREVATPVADMSGPIPFRMAQRLFDPEYPDGRRYYWKSTYLQNLDDDVVRELIKHAGQRPSPITSLDIWALGGAMARVKPEATAFVQRSAPFLLGIESNWDDPAEDAANIAWARGVFTDMQRFSPGGMYLNFPGFGEEGEKSLQESYGDNYRRLQAIKAIYDPDNFFRHNLNIRAGL